jgi:hypothetical protein
MMTSWENPGCGHVCLPGRAEAPIWALQALKSSRQIPVLSRMQAYLTPGRFAWAVPAGI